MLIQTRCLLILASSVVAVALPITSEGFRDVSKFTAKSPTSTGSLSQALAPPNSCSFDGRLGVCVATCPAASPQKSSLCPNPNDVCCIQASPPTPPGPPPTPPGPPPTPPGPAVPSTPPPKAPAGSSPLRTTWKIENKQLQVSTNEGGYTPFLIRGVAWGPTQIGDGPGDPFHYPSAVWKPDIEAMRAMGANSVKSYDFNITLDHTSAFDTLYNGGKNPIYTVPCIWIPAINFYDDPTAPSDSTRDLVKKYANMTANYADHPAVIGCSIGGEINQHPHVGEKGFLDVMALSTAAARKGIASRNGGDGNAKMLFTTFVDDQDSSLSTGEQYGADIDIWGADVYGPSLQQNLDRYRSGNHKAPLAFTEYGLPFSTRDGSGKGIPLEGDDEVNASKALLSQVHEIEKDYARHDAVTVGGFLFEWSDEWWKKGNPSAHDWGGNKVTNFPGGYWDEEWFGLNSIFAQDGDVDGRTPRTIVSLLADLWGGSAPSAPAKTSATAALRMQT